LTSNICCVLKDENTSKIYHWTDACSGQCHCKHGHIHWTEV